MSGYKFMPYLLKAFVLDENKCLSENGTGSTHLDHVGIAVHLKHVAVTTVGELVTSDVLVEPGLSATLERSPPQLDEPSKVHLVPLLPVVGGCAPCTALVWDTKLETQPRMGWRMNEKFRWVCTRGRHGRVRYMAIS